MNGLRINKNTNFKGYDARALQGVVMRNAKGFNASKIAYEMREIGAKHGFDVVLDSKLAGKKPYTDISILKKIQNFFTEEYSEYMHPWIQDIMYFTKGKMLIRQDEETNHKAFCQVFGIAREKIPYRKFISGGNLFLLQDGNKEKILVGKSEKYKKAAALFPDKEITRLPQADFHIDLFVRPLKDNVVIAADDDMTLAILKNAERKLWQLILQDGEENLNKTYENLCKIIKNMQTARKSGNFADTSDVILTLENNNYKVVRVPGRIYHDGVSRHNPMGTYIHKLNFINAVAATDKNGEIVYISNKTNLQDELGLTPKLAKELGLDFEDKFKESVKNYIKPDNVYFIEGGSGKDPKICDNIAQILEETHGGIHCLCAEIPK